MNIWIIMPFCLFGVMILTKQMEKKAVFKQPHAEKKILFVKERRSLWKVAGYMTIGGVIFFGIQPETVTVGMAFFKVTLVCAIFFLDSIMQTKLYITDKHIYMIERFRNRSYVHAKMMNTEDIYNVEASKHYPGVYFLYYFGKGNAANRIALQITKPEERELFKFILKERMNINVFRESESTDIHDFKPNAEKLDIFSKAFIWVAFITIILAIVKATKTPHPNLTGTETIISYLFVGLAIPLSLYLFSYFFILTSGIIKRLYIIRVKTVAFYLIVASSSWPFYQLLQKGEQTKDVFFKTQLSGLLLFVLIMFAGFSVGIAYKSWQEKRQKQTQKING